MTERRLGGALGAIVILAVATAPGVASTAGAHAAAKRARVTIAKGVSPAGKRWRVLARRAPGGFCTSVQSLERPARRWLTFAGDCWESAFATATAATDCAAGETYFYGVPGPRVRRVVATTVDGRRVRAGLYRVPRSIRPRRSFFVAVLAGAPQLRDVRTYDARVRVLDVLSVGYADMCR